MKEGPLRILLIEDEESLRIPLAKYLNDTYSYQVDAAADAARAWKLVTETGLPYDVALIDDQLIPEPGEEPEPIGIELMEQIKRHRSETECIVFTGWGMERALEAMQAGAYRYLAKPLNLDELGMTIRLAAEQAQLRQERELLSVTLAISNAMVSKLEVAQTLKVITNAVSKLVGAEACAVAQENPVTGQIQYKRMILLGNAAVQWQRHLKKRWLTREVIETNQVFVLPNVDTYADVEENLRCAGVKSFIGIPIPGKPRIQGVLYAYSTRYEAFGPHEQRVLELLERQLTQTLADYLKVTGLNIASVCLIKIVLPDNLQRTIVQIERDTIEPRGRVLVLKEYADIFGNNLIRVMPYIVQWELLNILRKNGQPHVLLTSPNLSGSGQSPDAESFLPTFPIQLFSSTKSVAKNNL